jgi:cytochrome c oxidase subunit 2
MEEKGVRSRKSIEGLLLAGVLVVLAVYGAWMGAKQWLPPLASEHGAGIDVMIGYLMLTVGALFVIGHVVLAGFVWRFSRQDRVTHAMASAKAERLWSLVPIVLMAVVAEGGVLVLGLPVWGKLYGSPAPAGAVTIEVTAEQFAWNVRYPGTDGAFGRTNPRLIKDDNPLGLDKKDAAGKDDIIGLGSLHVPVGRPVRIRLRSKDTLHSFYLPHFRIKQDCVPGMGVEVWFVPTQVGEYEIACAELCGFFHFSMKGVLRVLPPEKFDQWLKEQPAFSDQ